MGIQEIVVLISRCILLLGILGSYMYVVNKILKIEIRIVPIFVISSITLVIYLGGMFDILVYTVYAIIIGAALAFIYVLICGIRNGFKPFSNLTFFNLFFGVGSAIFLIQILNTNLVHYDNFTHWAVVVKEILISDAFPTPDAIMIEFTNYPLGTASFIYFVCKIIGNYENVMLFAQGLIIFSCLSAVFGVIEQKRRVLLSVFLATGCSMLALFNYAVRISDLLVDFIIPILTLAVIVTIYRHREEINKSFIAIIPMLGFLTIIKSTGVIYASIAVCYLIYAIIKYRKINTSRLIFYYNNTEINSNQNILITLWNMLVTVGISSIPIILWYWRMNTMFAEVENKFEVDASMMNGIYGDKSIADVDAIIQLFIETILDITQRATIGFILFNAIGVIACIVGYFILKKRWAIGKALIALNLIVAAYLAGILAMYLISMPLEEAMYLAGFERYAASIIVFFGGAIAVCLTVDIEHSFYYRLDEVEDYKAFRSIKTKTRYNYGVIICMMICFLILSSEYNGIGYVLHSYEDTMPYRVKEVVGDSWEEEISEETYLVYASDELGEVTSYYLAYISQYYLRSQKVDTLCCFYEENFLNLLSGYDKLIIIDSDDEVKELMAKYFEESGESGTYCIADLMMNLQ